MNYIRHLSGFFIRLAEDQRMTPYHISLYLALFQQWNSERFGDWFVISRSEMMQLSRIGSANTYARCMKELSDWGYIMYTASSNLYSGSRVSCIRFDTATDTASSTGTNTGTKSDTASDIDNDTEKDTGTTGNTESDTGRSIATDTGIKTDTTTDTGTDTARSTATSKNEPAGIKSDTACDTGSDTLLINSLNKNKQEGKSVRRNHKDDFDENEKKRKRLKKENSENPPYEKGSVPDLPEVEQFFEQSQFSRNEAQKFYAHYQLSGWKTGDQMKIQNWHAVARKWMINTQNFRSNEREHNQIRTGKLNVTVNKNYNEPL